MGEAVALFSAICWALSAISAQRGVKKLGPSEGALISTLVNILIFIPPIAFRLLMGRGQLPVSGDGDVQIIRGLSLLTATGLFSVSGKMLSYLSISHIGSNRSIQLRQSEPVFGILIGVAVLGERLFRRQWLGIALVVAGILYLVRENNGGEAISPGSSRAGAFFAFLAGFGFAASKAIRKGGLNYYPSPLMASALNSLGSVICLLLLTPSAGKGFLAASRGKDFPSNCYFFILAGIFTALANLSSSWALLKTGVSTVTVIGSTSIFFTMLFNSIFTSTGEKFNIRLVATGILIVGGISLLVFPGSHG